MFNKINFFTALQFFFYFILLFVSRNVIAGTSMFEVPAIVEFTLSQERGNVGDIVSATLEIKSYADIPNLKFIISNNECAQEIIKANPRMATNIKHGDTFKIVAKFKITKEKPCNFFAQIISFDERESRLGSIYGAILNPAVDTAKKFQRRGHTAQGDPTIEVILKNDKQIK